MMFPAKKLPTLYTDRFEDHFQYCLQSENLPGRHSLQDRFGYGTFKSVRSPLTSVDFLHLSRQLYLATYDINQKLDTQLFSQPRIGDTGGATLSLSAYFMYDVKDSQAAPAVRSCLAACAYRGDSRSFILKISKTKRQQFELIPLFEFSGNCNDPLERERIDERMKTMHDEKEHLYESEVYTESKPGSWRLLDTDDNATINLSNCYGDNKNPGKLDHCDFYTTQFEVDPDYDYISLDFSDGLLDGSRKASASVATDCQALQTLLNRFLSYDYNSHSEQSFLEQMLFSFYTYARAAGSKDDITIRCNMLRLGAHFGFVMDGHAESACVNFLAPRVKTAFESANLKFRLPNDVKPQFFKKHAADAKVEHDEEPTLKKRKQALRSQKNS